MSCVVHHLRVSSQTPAGAPIDIEAVRRDVVAHEQVVVDALYELWADEVRRTAVALEAAATADIGSTPAAINDQEALVRSHAARLTQLQAAESRLCFGRIDRVDGGTFHLGRVGLAEPDGGQRALLDWRAPAAAAFYQATGATPLGLARRRHLRTRQRQVTDVHDEVLDPTWLGGSIAGDSRTDTAAGAGDASLDADAALLAALDAPRDGRMHEVVETIQAEQDRIIRAPMRGTLVVQGAPGTGKTVVALHRAAYLLYTYRERLRSGVLVVGPGRHFLDYIGQVLPSLGETGATLTALGQFHAGIDATAAEPVPVATLKGDLRMVEVLRQAAADLPTVPDRPVPLDVDGDTVLLRPRDVRSAVDRARSERTPHNEARVVFVQHVLERLLRGLADVVGYSAEDVVGGTRVELLRALHASRDVRREVNRCWPLTTPDRLLRRLYRDPAVLRRATRGVLSDAERDLLLRDPDQPWSVADAALLDEAAELLGEDPEPRRRAAAAAAAARSNELDYAQGVAQMVGDDGAVDPERLAARYSGAAAVDEDGGPRTYGHVVVDEAQELNPMQWRAVLRRCPPRSMTVVGDMAQGTSPGASRSWAEAFAPHLADDRWTVAELTVNYRLPRAINELAERTMRAAGVAVSPARSVRSGQDAVQEWPATPDDLAKVVATVAGDELSSTSGNVAVVVAASRRAALLADLEGLADLVAGLSTAGDRLSVLTPLEAKGLEFDAVLLVMAREIRDEAGPRGLYIALTRATQRLHLIGDLPSSPQVR